MLLRWGLGAVSDYPHRARLGFNCGESPRNLRTVSDFTRMLNKVEQGDPRAAEALLPLVYEELRRLAGHKMANERADHTLQPTALVHEAWLRLVNQETSDWQGRARTGTFVVRINGEWVDAISALKTAPATTR